MNHKNLNLNCQLFNLENFVNPNLINKLQATLKRFRIFDPLTTLNFLVFQSISNKSLKEALDVFQILRTKNKLDNCSNNTSAICQAKSKLDLETVKEIAKETGKQNSKGNIFLVDGTVFDCQDTEEIKLKYKKCLAKDSKEVGFPKIRMLGIICATTGVFVDGELGPYLGKGTSEVSLLLKLISRLKKKVFLLWIGFSLAIFYKIF